jgi:hypothetical protein
MTADTTSFNPALGMQHAHATPVCRVLVWSLTSVVKPEGMSRAEQLDKLLKSDSYKQLAGLPKFTPGGGFATGETTWPYAILGREAFAYYNSEGLRLKNAQGTSTAMPIQWAVLNARVNLTRQWNCSSASFQIAHPITNTEDLHIPPILPNDVVAIEMGYIDSPLVRVANPDGSTNYKNFSGDVVFFGCVDSIAERGGSGESDGVVFTVKCRDMMRYLNDNKMRGSLNPEGVYAENRAFLVRDLIYRGAAIDPVQFVGDRKAPGDKPEPREAERDAKTRFTVSATFGQENCYVKLGLIEKSSRREQVVPDVRGKTPVGMLIVDKFPLQLIKHYSLMEDYPREVFADHRTGVIHWMARRTDGRRLFSTSPQMSATRQYFYRYPTDRANILNYTSEWSTHATITHFMLTNPRSDGASHQPMDIVTETPYAILRDPQTGRYLRPLSRTRFVYDETITNEALELKRYESVLGALYFTLGRAIEVTTIVVPGDPTLTIGEAVQVFNTGYFGRRFDSKGQNTQGGDATKIAPKGIYDDLEANHEGIHRIEAVQHMFAVGGVKRGYVSVVLCGPIDLDGSTDNGVNRVIRTEVEFNAIRNQCLTATELDINYVPVKG